MRHVEHVQHVFKKRHKYTANFPISKIFCEVFQFFFIDCEKSKKAPKSFLPQKVARTDNLTPNLWYQEQNVSQNHAIKQQIDKTPKNPIFTQILCQSKKSINFVTVKTDYDIY